MGFVHNFISSSFPHQHIIKDTDIKLAHTSGHSNQKHTPHTSAIPLGASELLDGRSVHPMKPRNHQLWSQLKENWVCLAQFCAFYRTTPIHILQVFSAASSCPYVTSHQLRHTAALTWQMIQILTAHCKSNSFSQLPGNIISNQLKYSFVQQSPQTRKGQCLCHMPPDHSTRQQQGIQGSSLITKEQKLPGTEWEKQVNRTKRAICYTRASQKNAYIVLSELSVLLCLLVQLNQSIPQVGCYTTGAGKLNQTTQFSTRD